MRTNHLPARHARKLLSGAILLLGVGASSGSALAEGAMAPATEAMMPPQNRCSAQPAGATTPFCCVGYTTNTNTTWTFLNRTPLTGGSLSAKEQMCQAFARGTPLPAALSPTAICASTGGAYSGPTVTVWLTEYWSSITQTPQKYNTAIAYTVDCTLNAAGGTLAPGPATSVGLHNKTP